MFCVANDLNNRCIVSLLFFQEKKKAGYHPVKNHHQHVYGNKFDCSAGAKRTCPKTSCGILMNPLCCDGGRQMNLATSRVAAIPLGLPRQSQSCHTALSVKGPLKSVGCQAPSNTTTPVKDTAEEFLKKPDTSTCSIKVQNIILHEKFVY